MSDSVIENGKGGAAPLAVSYNVSEVRDWIALLKPRVMSLVVFSAVAGLLVAPGHLHPALSVIAILCIAVAAGASGAINMWYDRDIDAVMRRTARRPVQPACCRGIVCRSKKKRSWPKAGSSSSSQVASSS